MGEIRNNFETLTDREESTRFRYPVESVKGDKGDAATVSVGKTVTREAGKPAEVVNTGTTSDAVLDFYIPKGDKGEKGDPLKVRKVETNKLTPDADPVVNVTQEGQNIDLVFNIPQGVKGDKGDSWKLGNVNTNTLEPDTPARVEIKENDNNIDFDFYIPKGVKGDKGDKGDTGTAATVNVGKTVTREAGKPAEVVNTGTTSDAVLDFYIPKGDKGEKGDPPTLEVGSVEWVDDVKDTKIEITQSGAGAYSLAFTLPHWRGEKGEKGDTPHYEGNLNSPDDLPASGDYLDFYFVKKEKNFYIYIYDGTQWQEAAPLSVQGLDDVYKQLEEFENKYTLYETFETYMQANNADHSRFSDYSSRLDELTIFASTQNEFNEQFTNTGNKAITSIEKIEKKLEELGKAFRPILSVIFKKREGEPGKYWADFLDINYENCSIINARIYEGEEGYTCRYINIKKFEKSQTAFLITPDFTTEELAKPEQLPSNIYCEVLI